MHQSELLHDSALVEATRENGNLINMPPLTNIVREYRKGGQSKFGPPLPEPVNVYPSYDDE